MDAVKLKKLAERITTYLLGFVLVLGVLILGYIAITQGERCPYCKSMDVRKGEAPLDMTLTDGRTITVADWKHCEGCQALVVSQDELIEIQNEIGPSPSPSKGD